MWPRITQNVCFLILIQPTILYTGLHACCRKIQDISTVGLLTSVMAGAGKWSLLPNKSFFSLSNLQPSANTELSLIIIIYDKLGCFLISGSNEILNCETCGLNVWLHTRQTSLVSPPKDVLKIIISNNSVLVEGCKLLRGKKLWLSNKLHLPAPEYWQNGILVHSGIT